MPAPPEPLMPLSIAVRPGAKPREFLIDEAAGERLMRDVVVALAGIRAAKAAVLAMTAPVEATIYCGRRHESGEYCELDYGHPGTCAYTSASGEEVTWRAPVTCPAVSPDGDACTEAGAHQFHRGPDDDGMHRMWTDADALAASIATGQPLTVAEDEPPCGLRLWGDTALCELPAGHDPLPSCKGTPRPFARTTAAPAAPSAAEVANAFNAQYGVPAPFPPATDPAEAADPGYLEDAAAQDDDEAGDPFLGHAPSGMQGPAPVARVLDDGERPATWMACGDSLEDDLALMFRVHGKTVTRWAKAGKLTAIRTLGGHRRYREAEVRALLAGIPAAVAEPATHCPDCLYPAGSRNHETACGGAS